MNLAVRQSGMRRLFAFFLVLFGLSVAKHAYLARYAHPGADDYCYAAKARGLSLAAWSAEEYANWNGRYASNLLMARGPLSWSDDFLPAYRLMPVLLLAITFLGAWAFVRSCTGDALRRWQQAAAALLFLGLFVHGMPDLAEGFYWYTGAMTYQLANALSLVYLACLSAARRSVAWLAASALLLLAIAGMNEVHMLLLIGFQAALLGWVYSRTRRLEPSLVLLFLLAVACGLVVAAAPGNAVRLSYHANTHALGYSLGASLLQTGRFVVIWMLSPLLLALSVLYVPVHRQLRARLPLFATGSKVSPVLSAVLLVLVVFACVFPAYWNTGVLGQYRTLNVARFFFLLLWFVNLSVWLEHPWDRRLSSLRLSPGLVAALLLVALADANLSRNGRRAWTDLLEGRAARYDAALLAREARLREAAPDENVVLTPLKDTPYTLFTLEERRPDQRWMTGCTARYFGVEKDRVRVAP